MNKLLILALISTCVACGKAPPDSKGIPEQSGTVAVTRVTFDLDASLELPANTHQDGFGYVPHPTVFVVPDTLEVRANSSERSAATLSIDYVECSYTHAAGGNAYSFDGCDNGALPGDSLPVTTRVKLRVEYGPGMSQTTAVHVSQ